MFIILTILIIFAATNKKDMIKNKELQDSRMRGYFIEATRNLLKSEGLKSVSVRSVAEQAGYSFATIYNYFRDIKELVFLCVEDFQNECRAHAETRVKPGSGSIEKIIEATTGYAEYFTEYPGIFELFYLERMMGFGYHPRISAIIADSYIHATQSAWHGAGEELRIKGSNEEYLKRIIRDTVVCELLLYLNRRIPEDYQQFNESLRNHISLILDVRPG